MVLNMEDGQEELIKNIKNLDYNAVKRIIDRHHQNPRMVSIDLNEALLVSVKMAHVEIVKLLLLQKSVRVSYQDEHQRCAIHYAAEMGSLPVLKQIIRAGSNLNKTDGEGMTPIHYAARSGNLEMIETLLYYGARVRGALYSSRSQVNSPLHLAIKSGKKSAVQILVFNGADVNHQSSKDHMTPLHRAVVSRYEEIVKFLVSSKADINAQDSQGRTPLHLAISNKLEDISEFLLTKGAEPGLLDHSGHNALHASIFYRLENITDLLLETDQSLVSLQDHRGFYCLHKAAMVGLANDAVRLLNAGAQIDIRDGQHGASPLSLSISHNRLEFSRVLIYSGASVHTRDFEGSTPLHKLQYSKHPDKCELAELLLEYEATVNPQTDKDYSPLDQCVFQCMLNNYSRHMLHLLVVNGAYLHPMEVHSKISRNSPLCWLVWKGDLRSARYLVRVGWDIRQEKWLNLPGKNPQQMQFLSWLQDHARQTAHLTNLCRSAIRTHLNVTQNDREICSSINQLPLPSMLKKFLLFHDEANDLLEGDKRF